MKKNAFYLGMLNAFNVFGVSSNKRKYEKRYFCNQDFQKMYSDYMKLLNSYKSVQNNFIPPTALEKANERKAN